MGKCEYKNKNGRCTLNECMYGDFLERDDSMFGTGYPICFKPEAEVTNEKINRAEKSI